MGMSVGEGTFVSDDVWIDTRPGTVEIGNNCVIGRRVTILTHDGLLQPYVGRIRIEPVRVLDGSVLEPGCFIMPGVTIGPGAVVKAGAVVTRSVPPHTVVVGSPARRMMSTQEMVRQYELDRQQHPERYLEDSRTGRYPLPLETEDSGIPAGEQQQEATLA
jgi:acetyltransferase-like isoleucine patch superfamily enzyme